MLQQILPNSLPLKFRQNANLRHMSHARTDPGAQQQPKQRIVVGRGQHPGGLVLKNSAAWEAHNVMQNRWAPPKDRY